MPAIDALSRYATMHNTEFVDDEFDDEELRENIMTGDAADLDEHVEHDCDDQDDPEPTRNPGKRPTDPSQVKTLSQPAKRSRGDQGAEASPLRSNIQNIIYSKAKSDISNIFCRTVYSSKVEQRLASVRKLNIRVSDLLNLLT